MRASPRSRAAMRAGHSPREEHPSVLPSTVPQRAADCACRQVTHGSQNRARLCQVSGSPSRRSHPPGVRRRVWERGSGAHVGGGASLTGSATEVVRAFFDAAARADLDAIAEVVTDGVQFSLPDGRTLTRSEIGPYLTELGVDRLRGNTRDRPWIIAQDIVEHRDSILVLGEVRLPGQGSRRLESDVTWRLQMEHGRIHRAQVHAGTGIMSALVIAASEETAERSFEYTLAPVLTLNDDRQYVDANSAACELFAGSREQLRTLRFEDLMPTEARGEALRLWGALLTDGEQFGSSVMVGLDGRRHEMEFRARAHFMPGRHLWVLRDVTPEAVHVPADEPAILSLREREVMGHLARGRTGEEIAEAIFLSPHTVRTHIRNAVEKLGTHTRAGAVAKALQLGEIGFESSLSASLGGIRAGRIHVALSGVLDLDTADDFLSLMREQLATGPVLLDLRRLTFMDSSGVRALSRMQKECSQKGWSVSVLADMPGLVRQVLRLTGMLDSLPIEPGDPPS